ncbi:hypothetical protein [Flavobacterium microcysteis]
MELIITIEIKPHDYAKNEYESPKGSAADYADEWNAYWLKSISDSHLHNLKSIKNGSFLVDVASIHETALEIILQQQLEDVEWDFFEEQIGKLSGGIVVKENDNFRIEPMCCGDIGTTKDWEQIFETATDSWTQLWIGHPWVFYKRNNGIIEFSDYTESTPEDLKDIKSLFSVSETDLKNQLSNIRKQQDEFELSIRKVLNKIDIPHAERVSKLMTGNG